MTNIANANGAPIADEDTTMVDAIALLKSDHRKVEGLFVQYEASEDPEEKTGLAHQICTELKVHTLIEEEIFYPALAGKVDADLLDEAHVEHDGAKVLINDIASGSAGDGYYDAKVKVLSEEIKHHVKEEEMPETGIFAQARAAGIDLIALGAELKDRKIELMAEASQGPLPPARPTVVNVQPA